MDDHLELAKAAVSRFSQRLASASAFDEGLANDYNTLRSALAYGFKEMALEALPRRSFDLGQVKEAVIREMRRLFEGRVDSQLFRIARYTTPHPDLYALLADNVGLPVPAWRLRLLTGDAIHTERRTRELRDLGLDIRVTPHHEDPLYCLAQLEPDLAYGAAFQLRQNALGSKAISPAEKAQALHIAEQTAKLPKRRSSG